MVMDWNANSHASSRERQFICNASGLYNSNIGNGNVEEHSLGINDWAYLALQTFLRHNYLLIKGSQCCW